LKAQVFQRVLERAKAQGIDVATMDFLSERGRNLMGREATAYSRIYMSAHLSDDAQTLRTMFSEEMSDFEKEFKNFFPHGRMLDFSRPWQENIDNYEDNLRAVAKARGGYDASEEIAAFRRSIDVTFGSASLEAPASNKSTDITPGLSKLVKMVMNAPNVGIGIAEIELELTRNTIEHPKYGQTYTGQTRGLDFDDYARIYGASPMRLRGKPIIGQLEARIKEAGELGTVPINVSSVMMMQSYVGKMSSNSGYAYDAEERASAAFLPFTEARNAKKSITAQKLAATFFSPPSIKDISDKGPVGATSNNLSAHLAGYLAAQSLNVRVGSVVGEDYKPIKISREDLGAPDGAHINSDAAATKKLQDLAFATRKAYMSDKAKKALSTKFGKKKADQSFVLRTVQGPQLSKVETLIQQKWDQQEHGHMSYKIRGVYEIEDPTNQKNFEKAKQQHGNSRYLYHGTDFASGTMITRDKFKLSKTKAGRMLGDGVYLAENSSKSAQYLSDRFTRRRGSRGTLLVCEAALGKVQEGHLRAHDGDTAVMYKGKGVRNTEYCVKDTNAVLPRLWVDLELL
jgi:hypothetical protein